MAVLIIASNTEQINRAIPVLANAYNQIEDFAAQIQTAVDIAAVDPTTVGPFTMILETQGLDASASPALQTYEKWTVTISWSAADSEWQIDSIIRLCNNQENTIQ